MEVCIIKCVFRRVSRISKRSMAGRYLRLLQLHRLRRPPVDFDAGRPLMQIVKLRNFSTLRPDSRSKVRNFGNMTLCFFVAQKKIKIGKKFLIIKKENFNFISIQFIIFFYIDVWHTNNVILAIPRHYEKRNKIFALSRLLYKNVWSTSFLCAPKTKKCFTNIWVWFWNSIFDNSNTIFFYFLFLFLDY